MKLRVPALALLVATVSLLAVASAHATDVTGSQYGTWTASASPYVVEAETGPPPVAGDISVPGDYATIQEAIDAADSGQVVTVAAGTYVGRINLKKGVSLIGAGAESTIIDGDGESGAVWGADDARISGFTITNSQRGVFVWSSSPTIDNCVLTANGQGIATDANAVIRHNLIIANTDYGIFTGSEGLPTITNNLVVANAPDAAGITMVGGGGTVVNNTVDANGK